MGEGVLKVGVVSSSVTVEQLRQCWTVLGGVEHKHQCAQIAGIFNVWLLKVFSDMTIMPKPSTRPVCQNRGGFQEVMAPRAGSDQGGSSPDV